MGDPTEITCAELVEVVNDYLEGLLDRRARRRFEAHLSECAGCDAYLDEMRTTIALTGRLREDALEPEIRATLLRLFNARRRLSPG